MALINCKECGKEISDSAKQCPHCGCRTQFGKNVVQTQGLNVMLIVACLSGLIGMFLFWSGLLTMLEGINDYGGFFRWFNRYDGAGGIFVKVCFGWGMLIASSILSIKVYREAKWQAYQKENPTVSTRIPDELFEETEEDTPLYKKREVSVPSNSWRCHCGRINANYVTTCTCGKNKGDK